MTAFMTSLKGMDNAALKKLIAAPPLSLRQRPRAFQEGLERALLP